MDVHQMIGQQNQGELFTLKHPVTGETASLRIRHADGHTEWVIKVREAIQKELEARAEKNPEIKDKESLIAEFFNRKGGLTRDEEYHIERLEAWRLIVGWDPKEWNGAPVQVDGQFNEAHAKAILQVDWIWSALRTPLMASRGLATRALQENQAKNSASSSAGDSATDTESRSSNAGSKNVNKSSRKK